MNTQLVTYSYYQSNLLFYKEFGLNYHYREDQWLLIVLL